jgi:hypothetical protein
VPMPDGSSSDAPVISPGPSNSQNRFRGLDSVVRRASSDLVGALMCGIRRLLREPFFSFSDDTLISVETYRLDVEAVVKNSTCLKETQTLAL